LCKGDFSVLTVRVETLAQQMPEFTPCLIAGMLNWTPLRMPRFYD